MYEPTFGAMVNKRMTKTIDDMLARLNEAPPKTNRSSFKDLLGFGEEDKQLKVPEAIIEHAKHYVPPKRTVIRWNGPKHDGPVV